jgi:hypothetical protein
MKSLLFFLFVVLLFSQCNLATKVKGSDAEHSTSTKLYFNPHRSKVINEEKRNLWIKRVVDSLSSLGRMDSFEVSMPNITDYENIKMISYRINRKGKIVFQDGQSISIFLHSAHEDSEIGDISVAIDKNNMIYINLGHVCGGIAHFNMDVAQTPLNSKIFFAKFYSDTDGDKWIKFGLP